MINKIITMFEGAPNCDYHSPQPTKFTYKLNNPITN